MTRADRYAAAGVKLGTADEAKRRIAELVRATRTPLARGKIGGFGGMVRVPDGYRNPVLVMSTDGVGTKVLVAAAAGIHDTVGEDLVNHSVNDILVHGATPLAFLDYIATGQLVPEIAAQIVTGVARGCRAHDMTLAGGETAQLPDLYEPGHYDLAGAIVGVVEEDQALHGDRVAPGDQIVGYASTGLHTNGYTLARQIVFAEMKLRLDDPFPETEQTVAQVLLAVHRSYAEAVKPVLPGVHALAHVTGGGVPGNLPRVLPPGLGARLEPGGWQIPPIFRFIQRLAGADEQDIWLTLNMGLGLLLICRPEAAETCASNLRASGTDVSVVGRVESGEGVTIG